MSRSFSPPLPPPPSGPRAFAAATGRALLFAVLALAFGTVEVLVFVSEQGRKIFRGARVSAVVRSES